MPDAYRVAAEKSLQKKGAGRSQFYTAVAIADRLRDGQTGILLQHQQRRKDGSRRPLPASFFVPERDIPDFLRLVNELFRDNGHYLSESARARAAAVLGSGDGTEIRQLANEIGALEAQLEQAGDLDARKAASLRRQIRSRDKQLATLAEELEKVRASRQKVHILEMERQVPAFRHAVTEFRRLVDDGKQISADRGVQEESLYQDFLKDHSWMFGAQYIGAKPKPRSSLGRVPDLLLQRSDGFQDVVELENPTDDVFTKVRRRPEQSGPLKEALAQLMDYVDDFNMRHRDEYYEHGLDTYKPTGIIVIGRRGDRDLERRRRQLNSYLHGIEIWTFDDLITNAERVIELLETGPLGSAEKHLGGDEPEPAT